MSRENSAVSSSPDLAVSANSLSGKLPLESVAPRLNAELSEARRRVVRHPPRAH